VVLAGDCRLSDRPARALADSLGGMGFDVTYIGHEVSGRSIAAAVLDSAADSVEICLTRTGGVPILRELLRELTSAGRHHVSIVVHRVD
jgi:methylmalonyl-CoA mutase cobalamin-binding subunit